MTNLMQVTENAAISMTSLEIVEFINSRRPEGSAELTHADFMKKVPKVLGEKDAGNFSDIYFDAYNREQRCYRFPKRESMLMAMSYDYAAQAAIYDRWQELETQIRLPAVTADHSELLVEINARLEGIERTQTPTLAKKSVQNWNGHYARDLARVQGEIRTLKLRIKQIEPKPDGEQAERSYLKRLIQHQLILEEIIHRNNQYQQLWSQYQTLLEQVENS